MPDPRFYFPSSQHEEGLHRLLYAVTQRKGAAMLTGEVGCGKTLLSREFLGHLRDDRFNVALITNPDFPAQQFLHEVLYQFGIDTTGSRKVSMLHRFNEHLLNNDERQIQSVLVVDEAQAISDEQVLEELRLLLNFQRNDRFLLTLVLLGQPELREKLWAIPQFAQRIGIQYHLMPLEPAEVDRYVKFRIQAAGRSEELFDPEAVQVISECSKGIPRVINNLCDLCLLSGCLAKASRIDADLVRMVARNGYFSTPVSTVIHG
ncbi:MAG: AAA family ATPase [Nitrospirae bacterium]|nr:AAA family ATPase [Nitrospirota bacterium]